MKIVQAKTVELTSYEMKASAQFDRLLDNGHSIASAVKQVRALWPNLDPRFYRWLSNEELEIGKTVAAIEHNR